MCPISKYKINISIERVNLIEISLRKTAVKAFWIKTSADRNREIFCPGSATSCSKVFPLSPGNSIWLCSHCRPRAAGSPRVCAYVLRMAHHPYWNTLASELCWQTQKAEILNRSGKSNPAAKRLVLKCLTFSTRAEQIIYLINLVSSLFTSCPGAVAEICSNSFVIWSSCLGLQLVYGRCVINSHKIQGCVDCSWLGIRGRILF